MLLNKRLDKNTRTRKNPTGCWVLRIELILHLLDYNNTISIKSILLNLFILQFLDKMDLSRVELDGYEVSVPPSSLPSPSILII